MPLPMKALQYGQLVITTAGNAVPASGHEVYKVEFNDIDGEKKLGFYKPLGPTYPSLLAKISVAYSVLMRLSLGARVAEDRLVLDEEGTLLGTVSLTLPNFKPLLCTGEPLPLDEQEQEMRCPSTLTLLRYNVAELLVSEWRTKNDDSHPGNFSLMGLIDHDMRGYPPLTKVIKGPRVLGSVKEGLLKAVTLKSSQLEDFPNISDRTHWPANAYPGNLNLAKRYMAYPAFQELAKNPVFQTEIGLVSFQDQLFHAILKELVTFDPENLRARLIDYFGDLPLDFLGLEEDKKAKLSSAYPHLFTVETNSEPFVNFIQAFFQQEYDEFYRATVFYLGCERNSSVGFSQYLQNKPSSFQEVLHWTEDQNRLMDTAWKKQLAYQNFPKLEEPIDIANPFVDAYCIAPEARYDTTKLQRRYHQIWRDSHIFMIQEILSASRTLSAKLLNELHEEPLLSFMPVQRGLTTDDENLTLAWQLIDYKFDIDLPPAQADQDNNLRNGLMALNDFIKELVTCAEEYYRIERENLKIEDNLLFCKRISRIIQDYEEDIYLKLGATLWAKDFSKIVNGLQQCYGRLNFQRHLLAEDIALETKDKYDYSAILTRKHTEKEVMAAGLKTLFDWARKVDKDYLDAVILDIITFHYEPSSVNVVANRNRSQDVKRYLKTSMEKGDNKLAYILSSGGQSASSLNTMLIQHLMPLVLKDAISMVDVNLMSIAHACDKEQFDGISYAKGARDYAKWDARFTHIYAESSLRRFNNTMYKWVDLQKKAGFRRLILEVLAEYEPYSFNLFSQKTRGAEVRKYLQNEELSNQQILAYIFSRGDINDNSLNTLLFKRLINSMQVSLGIKKVDPDFKWVLEINFKNSDYFDHFLGSLKNYAKDKSHAPLRLTAEATPSKLVL